MIDLDFPNSLFGTRVILSDHLTTTKRVQRRLTRLDRFKLWINDLCNIADINQPSWSSNVRQFDNVTIPLMKVIQIGNTIYMHPVVFDQLRRELNR